MAAVVSGIRAGRGWFFLFVSGGEIGGPEGESERRVSYTAGAPASYMKYLYRGIFSKLIFDSHANLLHTWFLVDATLRGMMARFTRQPLFLLSAASFFPSLSSTNAGIVASLKRMRSLPRVSWKRLRNFEKQRHFIRHTIPIFVPMIWNELTLELWLRSSSMLYYVINSLIFLACDSLEYTFNLLS